jgi:uroporphyrinogen decarboxylase
MHSCGSITALLPDMIDAGLDAVNPVQTNCKLMEPERLKSQFRDQITLWGGGCNTQRILPKGTPEEVRADVFHNLDILFPGGGFVFQQIHNIQADVPPENIVAMFDAVAEWNELNP